MRCWGRRTRLCEDFPARAAAIAKIIKGSRPHFIGLQEISLVRTQEPSDWQANPQPNAETVEFDFLKELMGALQVEGLAYEVAGKVKNFDLEYRKQISIHRPTELLL